MHTHHSHHHDHSSSTKNIRVAFFLNLGFTLLEIVGGLFTNSLAVLSDAIHDLGDSVALGLSWYFQKLSSKSRDDAFSYGYRRFSLLGAFISAGMLITGSALILIRAIPRLFNPEHANVEGMFVLAIVGVIVNGAAVISLKRGDSVNERMVSLHLLEDVLGWIAVLIISIVMHFYELPILDPLLSIVITLLILFNVYTNIKTSLNIILQGTPAHLDIDQIKQQLISQHYIRDVHDTHAWSLDGRYHILTMHVVLDTNLPLLEQARIKNKIRETLTALNVQHSTIEFELPDENCINCDT